MRKIHILFNIINVVAALIIIAAVVVRNYDVNKGMILLTILDFSLGIALIFAVVHMRITIRATKFAIPNDKLVIIHLTNFAVWAVFFGA